MKAIILITAAKTIFPRIEMNTNWTKAPPIIGPIPDPKEFAVAIVDIARPRCATLLKSAAAA